ncbi:MAG: esterase/lipase family protein [Oscillospiraceae bacterium]
MDNKCKTKYPIVLVHGVGFRDLKWPVYWGRIPKALQEHGANIYYGFQDSWASMSTNSHVLKERISQILLETEAEKVNLIGHSKGGLEIRMVASSLGMGDKIASITTIATPHNGSKTIDRLLKAPKNIFNIAAFAVDNWIKLVGDKKPDFLTVCREFSTEHMRQFNYENPDCPGVFYQSYACLLSHPFSDINLTTANIVIKLIEGENDGLVTVSSAAWGKTNKVLRSANWRGISHIDAIDVRRLPFNKKSRPGYVSDIVDIYEDIAGGLKERGF